MVRRKPEMNIGFVLIIWTVLYTLMLFAVITPAYSDEVPNSLRNIVLQNPVGIFAIYITVVVGFVTYLSFYKADELFRWAFVLVFCGITLLLISAVPHMLALYLSLIVVSPYTMIGATALCLGGLLCLTGILPVIIPDLVKYIKDRKKECV